MQIFEVAASQIAGLSDEQLTSLLNRVLILEAEAHSIRVDAIEVGMNIRTGDGGIDASIRWGNGPQATRSLPSRYVVFQCKAENMGPAKCAAELVAADGTLKPMVAAALKNGATYILFTTGKANEKQKRERIEAMRSKLKALRAPRAKTAKIAIWSAEDIAKWVNFYLPAIVYVKAIAGFPVVKGLKTWTEWNAVSSRSWKFRPSSSSAMVLEGIRRALDVPQRSIRLNGLPGLGKTRLVLEALGPYGGGPGLAARVVYYDAEYEQTELTKHVVEWVRQGLSGILIVDNCPPQVHQTLQQEVLVPTSKLSLVTIFSDPAEDLRGVTQLVLKPCSDQELVAAAKDYTPGLQDSDAAKIAHLAGGFIFFAYLLCDAYSKRLGLDDVLVRPDELLKFLGGVDRTANGDALRTIEACSIFESVEYADGQTAEAASVVEISGIDGDRFHKYIQDFAGRGIIEKTGQFIRVRPHPLALRLCRDWWIGVRPERALAVFDAVPESMVNSLCERLRMLNTLPEARDVTAKLCKETAPFGQAEVLFSARGARIFRALAEVNPDSACASLHAVIDASTIQTLREARDARREWVWALTKLIFHRATYSLAADSLVKLALAENESFSNNATGTLVQTFQVVLPGTEMSLEERARKLDELFASEEPAIVELALSAADRALRGEYFSRTGGAEDQGSGPPLVDYEPTHAEAVEYWRRVISSIQNAVESGRCRQDKALPILSGHIRGFIRSSADTLAQKTVEIAQQWGVRPWDEGIDALRDALRYDIPEADADRVAKLTGWIEGLLPADNDVPGQLLLYVSRPSWSDVAAEHGDAADSDGGALELRVRGLAERCAADFDTWRPHLASLFFGEQRLGYAFGYHLANYLGEPDNFFNLALSTLKQAHERLPNLGVLCGFVHATSVSDRRVATQLVERFLSDGDLQQYAAEVLSHISPDLATLMRLVRLVASNQVKVATLERLAYGRALQHLSASDVSELISGLGSLSDEAAWVALEIGYMSFFGRTDEMWLGLRTAIRTLLISGRLRLGKDGRTRDSHTWEQCVLKLLEDVDDEFVISIAQQLVSSAAEGVSSSDLPNEVATQLLSSHAAAAWPIFGSALLGDDGLLSWNLSGFIGRGLRGDATEGKFPLASLDERVFEKWLRDNAGAAAKAARMIRLVEPNGEALAWTRFGRLMIDEFGQDAGVLEAVTSNLMSGVSWGPRTPFWKRIVALLDELGQNHHKVVKAWAKRFKTGLIANIAAEQREEHARAVGRW